MPVEQQEALDDIGRRGAIAEHLNDCVRLFDNYIDVDSRLNLQKAIQLKKRLEVWADYTGVRSRAGLKLDDRLLEYPDVKDAITGLLQLIATKLKESKTSNLSSSSVLISLSTTCGRKRTP